MRFLVWGFGFFLPFSLFAEEPDGYYQSAYGKSGYALKTALYQIIKSPDVNSYDGLWDAFRNTDADAEGKVWDMYADCNFSFGSDQCGNYKNECDCYNREHSFPKSWFDDAKPMYSDLFHLYPTDGKVNGMRGNYPFGEVDNPTWESNRGCKVGDNVTPGYGGKVFEPLDEYKGDFARTYFYMATCYEDRIANWGSCPICNGTSDQAFDDWVVELLLKWHEQDPVSAKEIDRNDAVYREQGNRNPFIDHPELVEKIWGDDSAPFGEDPDSEADEYVLPYAYFEADGTVVLRDTLTVSLSEKFPTKEQVLRILFPENADTVYVSKVTARIRLGGFTPDALNRDYSLESVSLSFDRDYRLEVSFCKNGTLLAEARSEFHVRDTLSENLDPEPGTGGRKLWIPYAYKDAEGGVWVSDTLYVPYVPVPEAKIGEEVFLLEEDFENLQGEDNSGTQADAAQCGQVLSFENAYAVNSGVRLASGKSAGAVNLKSFRTTEPFRVVLDGKGWTSDELECKVECPQCTVEEQPVSFTKSKDVLGSGEYETLPAIEFTPKDGEEEIFLSVTAGKEKRVLIGRISVSGGPSEPDPDPDPEPDTLVYWDRIDILSPEQAEELTGTGLVARLRLSHSEGKIGEGYYKLPEIELEKGNAYSLDVALWFSDILLDQASVGFSVKESEPETEVEIRETLSFSLYPNPNNGLFYLQVPDGSRVEIYSSVGRLVRVLPDVSGSVQLDLDRSGLYLVRVSKAGNSSVKRVVVR